MPVINNKLGKFFSPSASYSIFHDRCRTGGTHLIAYISDTCYTRDVYGLYIFRNHY